MASAALVALVALSGCQTDGLQSGKHLKELSPQMLAELQKKNMPKESPILVRLFKEESELEVWKQDTTGRFALLKTYPICRWSGELGPKIKEGDRQAPEGFYTITPAQMNPNSSFHLSFNMGYPNAFDRAHGRTGAHLMVHGDCSSRGCYAMTNDQIEEIYALGRESFFGGQKAFQVQAYPFRMTAQNFARHRNNPNIPFWKMLKEGNDHFEVTGQEPKVDVCEKRYVFNVDAQNATPIPAKLNPTGRCPVIQADPDVIAKQRQDEIKIAELSSSVRPAPVRTGVDGGMHKSFLAKLRTQEVREPDGTVRYVVDASAAKSLGSYVVPPEPGAEPVVTATAPAPVARPAAQPQPKSAPGQSMALASTDSKPAESRSGSMFGGLTSSVGRLFGRGEDAKPAPIQAQAPVPTPKPAPKPQQVAAPSTPAPQKPAQQPQQAQVQQPQPQQAPQPQAQPQQSVAQAAAPRPAAAASLMSGAQPVVPSNSFDNRWGAFR